MYLITKWFGTFLCDKNGIKKKILFSKDKKELVKTLWKIEKNKVLSEEKKISKGIKVVVQDKRLEIIGKYAPKDPFFMKIEIKPEDFGFSQDLLHKASLFIAQEKMKEKLQMEDLQIIQMVNALDELIHITNLLSERLDHWSLIPTPKNKIQP